MPRESVPIDDVIRSMMNHVTFLSFFSEYSDIFLEKSTKH